MIDLLCWHNAQQGQFHPIKRQGHTCVPYQQSMILFGGYSGQPVGDMWFLDTSTKYYCFSTSNLSIAKLRWTRFEPTGAKPGKRTGHTAVIIKDKMYIFGGETGLKCANDLWVFDICNYSFSFSTHFQSSKNVDTSRILRF